MAAPLITSLPDCASYAKTLQPYLAQLSALPHGLASAITNPEALKQLYLATNPAISGLAFTIATFPIFLLVSEINRNYSQVDRVWSILPTVYNAHYAVWARLNGLPTGRLDHVLTFSVVWTLRLTYNYWRKGGYEIGSEDYRWQIIKKKIGQPAFFLLNLLFVSSLQIVILYLATTPTYILLLTSRVQPSLTALDTTFSRLLLALVVFEYFADNQMWAYQCAKRQYQTTAKVPPGYTRAEMDRGFCTRGLWRYSRHPNFAAEQAIWVVLYVWGAAASGAPLNWTMWGAVGYLGVFAGSTPLTERISAGKYGEYKEYQKRVGRFVPRLDGGRWEERAPSEANGEIGGKGGKSGKQA